MTAETDADDVLAALNIAMNTLEDVKLSPQPDPSIVESLRKRVGQAIRAVVAADLEIDIVQDSNGRWVAFRTA